jgi:hypothetical protein
MSEYDSGKYGNYKNSINNDTWHSRIFQPKTLLLKSITADPKFESGIDYFEVTFEFWEKVSGWNPRKILDRGFMEKIGNELRNIRDRDKREGLAARLLNGQGQVATLPTNGVFLEFQDYAERNFSDLGIDNAPIT